MTNNLKNGMILDFHALNWDTSMFWEFGPLALLEADTNFFQIPLPLRQCSHYSAKLNFHYPFNS